MLFFVASAHLEQLRQHDAEAVRLYRLFISFVVVFFRLHLWLGSHASSHHHAAG